MATAPAITDSRRFRQYGTFTRLMMIGTGLSFRTLTTWAVQEGGPSDNPLNIMADYPRIARYGSQAKAAAATIALLRNPKNAQYGYGKIVGSAGKSDSEQLKAIAASKWEESHYENGKRLADTYKSLFPKESGSSVWDWVGQTVTDPGQSLKDAGSWYSQQGFVQFIANLVSAQFWVRVLMVLVGAIFLIGALIFFSRELGRSKLA